MLIYEINIYLFVITWYSIMTGKYYLAMFNYETWNEFLENHFPVYGTTFRIGERNTRCESKR